MKLNLHSISRDGFGRLLQPRLAAEAGVDPPGRRMGQALQLDGPSTSRCTSPGCCHLSVLSVSATYRTDSL